MKTILQELAGLGPRIRIAWFVGIGGIALGISGAEAHPLGNSAISHYAGIEISPEHIRVKYLLDFAEIPAFGELEQLDPDANDRVTKAERKAYLDTKTPEILKGLSLEVNGQLLGLSAAWSHLSIPPGEGRLPTLRIAWELNASMGEDLLLDQNFLVWADRNFEFRAGWKEVRFRGVDGIGIGRTSLRFNPSSNELSEYPTEYLNRPPNDTKAWCHFGLGMKPLQKVSEPDLSSKPGSGALARRLSQRPTPLSLATLLLCLLLGAEQSLLANGRGRVQLEPPQRALRRRLIRGAAQASGVLVFGEATLLLVQALSPESSIVDPFCGGLLALVGIAMTLLQRAARAGEPQLVEGSPAVPGSDEALSRRFPEALLPGAAVILGMMALKNEIPAILFLLAFSAGLAAGLASLTLLAGKQHDLPHLPLRPTASERARLASATLITLLGLAILVRSLMLA